MDKRLPRSPRLPRNDVRETNRKGVLQVRGVLVEADALLRLRHACDPTSCIGHCCCQEYEVCFTRAEAARAVGLMPASREFASHLAEGEDFENPFEPVGGGLLAIDATEDGACAFAFRDRAGAMWCSMHAAALKLGLSPWDVKAQVCMLWPLALSEGAPPVLGVQEDAFRFPCNQRTRRRKGLAPGVAECVSRGMGADFLEQLEQRIREWNRERS